MSDWKYYNHALIPNCAPHEVPNIEELKNKKIWKQDGKKALFARWTTDWDCKEETDWWYVIKDEPFDISKLKAKRRYEINKGNKNFKVKKINSVKYVNEICDTAFSVWEQYPSKYRPKITKQEFKDKIIKNTWKDWLVYGAFDINTNEFCGYAVLKEEKHYVDFMQLKAKTKFERNGLNFAIIYYILEDYKKKLNKDFYICDGTRNVLHETNFQDFLEKYFQFRKAYCMMYIKYKFPLELFIKALRPFRNLLAYFGSIGEKINAILFMNDIAEKCKRRE